MEGSEPFLEKAQRRFLLYCPVKEPCDPGQISIATKKCYAQALSQDLPVFFQCGVRVPLERLRAGEFTRASWAFLTTEQLAQTPNLAQLPEGMTACVYHFGNYYDIADSYLRLMEFCQKKGLRICSDSYEFCINDYITSRCEEEFITKILFYVEEA